MRSSNIMFEIVIKLRISTWVISNCHQTENINLSDEWLSTWVMGSFMMRTSSISPNWVKYSLSRSWLVWTEGLGVRQSLKDGKWHPEEKLYHTGPIPMSRSPILWMINSGKRLNNLGEGGRADPKSLNFLPGISFLRRDRINLKIVIMAKCIFQDKVGPN